MAEIKKKIDELESGIGALENQYASRRFSWDADSDAGYQDYLQLMRNSGKQAMQDTVGKASALTGGYANSYAVNAGQQAYNDFAKQGADAALNFRQMARDTFDAENQSILSRLNLLKEQKNDIWNDAALRAGFGDYSGYVENLGMNENTVKAAYSGIAAPTEAQIAFAKQRYAEGGDAAVDAYIASLEGVDTDAIITALEADDATYGEDGAKLRSAPGVLKSRMRRSSKGGRNWGGSNTLNNNAEFTLDEGTEQAVTHTVKEWFDVLTDPEGDYKWTEADAKKFLLDLQNSYSGG